MDVTAIDEQTPIRAEAEPSHIRPALMLTLALLSATAPFATDLYLAAFPSMTADLRTSATGVQLSLTAFLIGAGTGQVAFGAWSDRIGRLRPLQIGLALYVVASVGTAVAPSIGVLVALRLLQGFAGASGMVISRAMVSDVAHGREAAHAFSLLMLVGGVAPVIAPLAGSALAAPLGWRGLLWIVAALAVVALVLTLAVVRETRPAQVRQDRLQAHQGARGISALANRRFVGATLAFAFGFATMMAYISASPFVYQKLMGLSTIEYGLLFGLNALTLMAAAGASARLVWFAQPVTLVRIGLGVNLAASGGVALLATSDASPRWLIAPLLVAVGSLGLVMGNATATALGAIDRASTGLGSAALGLGQFVLAGVVAALVGVGGEHTAVPLGFVMVAASVVANAAIWGLVRNHH